MLLTSWIRSLRSNSTTNRPSSGLSRWLATRKLRHPARLRTGRRPLHVEALEDRCLLASGLGAALVADIVPGTDSSGPHQLVNANGALFFYANRSYNPDLGRVQLELWKSDGTAAGTVRAGGASLLEFSSELTSIGDTVFYPSNFSGIGDVLMKSDGTPVEVKRVGARRLTPANDKLFFSGSDDRFNEEWELWVSDGTESGTFEVRDINSAKTKHCSSGGKPGGGNRCHWHYHGSDPDWLTDVNGTLFFTAYDGTSRGLWKSNGRKGGTKVVKEVLATHLTNVGGTLFFAGNNGADGNELWKSDGTSRGTVLVKDIVPGSAASEPENLINVNGTLFFTADDGAHGRELWMSDGTTAGTVLVKDIHPGAAGSKFGSMANVNGALYFSVDDGIHGAELWRSDGAAASTVLVKDINPGAASATPSQLTNVNGLLYFSADDGSNGRELWQSDGTDAGTVMVQDIYLGSTGSSPGSLVAMNNRLYFAATDPDHGRELWDPPPVSGNGMTLVSQWNDHDHLYGDVWAEEITRGPHKGTYAFLGHFANEGGVDIIDMSDPTNPALASTFIGTGTGNEVFDVKVQNGIGYFGAEFEGGVYIADVSNPFAPEQLARIDPSNGGFRSVHNLFIDGDYLYTVDNRTPEIRVFDVSDPADPSFLQAISAPSNHGVHEVTVKNGRLYTATPYAEGYVAIYDIQNVGDLTAPVPLLTRFGIPGGATHSAYPSDDGRFVVITREWLSYDPEIWDITDLAAPRLASRISVPRDEAMTAHQPVVIGNLAYFAYFEAGLRVYDIADPYNPALVGDYDTYTGPYGVEGECAGRAGNGHGPFSDFDPYPVACGAWGVYPFQGNDRILVSDFDGGLFIVSLDNPPPLTAASASANPVDETISADQAQPLLNEAIVRWEIAGADASSLSNVQIVIADLTGAALGMASGNTIFLDINAAGWGWFVDPTPWEGSEFSTPGDQGEENHMDLLTVIAHELGHILGYEHDDGGVMAETLDVGDRHLSTPIDPSLALYDWAITESEQD